MGVGRLMVFDEFHDPNPPEPGMHEFALVAERAQGIRRRRAAWATRVASVVLLVGAGVAVHQVSEQRELRPVTTDATPSDATTPSETGSTLSLAGARTVRVAVTHALFGEGSIDRLVAAGAREVVSTDSIVHPSNVVPLAPSLADTLREGLA